MNLDPTSFVTGLVADLRRRRLWPVALVLVLALVAVPVVLSKAAPPSRVAQLPPASGASTAAGTALPAVSVQSGPSHSQLAGRPRDPFAQQHVAQSQGVVAGVKALTGSSSTSTAAAVSGGKGGSPAGTTTAARAPSLAGGSPSAPSGSTPVLHLPGDKPKPAPGGLTPTQSYIVTLAMTNSFGGIDTIDPLQRLSLLPDAHDPLLIELGVLQGAHRVLFAVQPGTVLSGPGICIPGPIDCEIVSLAPDQIETLAHTTSSGVTGVAQFAVTGIRVEDHVNATAALMARRSESAVGRLLISHSTLAVLPLFPYEPSIGAIVDQRDLSVRGS
ncbi:MAG: hypothetical protein ACYC91_11255 [Solirubrobacteraceae bacterium]